MDYGDSSYRDARQQHYLEQSRYGIAAAVLYAVAFLGGLAVTAVAFIKLRCGGLRHGFAAWFRLACVFFTLSCLLFTCAYALFSPLVRQAADGRQSYSQDRLKKQLDASQYISFIGGWFHNVTQGLLFIAIVSFCAATSTKAGSNGCLIVSGVLGTALNGLAAGIFALSVKQYREVFSSAPSQVSIIFILLDITLAFDCIMAAAALFAAVFALSRLSKSMHTDGKSAKLAAFASVLLLLSALYQLAVDVSYSWVYHPNFGPPNYLSVLGVILDTWALLGALALLFVAGKRRDEGGSMMQHKHSVA